MLKRSSVVSAPFRMVRTGFYSGNQKANRTKIMAICEKKGGNRSNDPM